MKRVRTHPYVGVTVADPRALKPIERCGTCGLPQANRRHELRPVSAEARAQEARRLGERPEVGDA